MMLGGGSNGAGTSENIPEASQKEQQKSKPAIQHPIKLNEEKCPQKNSLEHKKQHLSQ